MEATHVAATERRAELRSARKMPGVVTLSGQIERKARHLPRFVVVPAQLLKGWQLGGTTVVEAMMNGIAVGRRSLKRWDDDRWFVELAQPMSERIGVDTGDPVTLSLRLASRSARSQPNVMPLARRGTAYHRLAPVSRRLQRPRTGRRR